MLSPAQKPAKPSLRRQFESRERVTVGADVLVLKVEAPGGRPLFLETVHQLLEAQQLACVDAMPHVPGDLLARVVGVFEYMQLKCRHRHKESLDRG